MVNLSHWNLCSVISRLLQRLRRSSHLILTFSFSLYVLIQIPTESEAIQQDHSPDSSAL